MISILVLYWKLNCFNNSILMEIEEKVIIFIILENKCVSSVCIRNF